MGLQIQEERVADHAHTRVELTNAVIKFIASRGQMGIQIGKK